MTPPETRPLAKPLTSILVKPAGPDCNLACTYCFYLEKAELFPGGEGHRMSETVLEEMIRQFMSQAGPQISFGWQGGEPTLMGLPFFEKVVEFQKKYGRGHEVGNGLQTNGLLVDINWAAFLEQYQFLVGLSLDGPEHIHDRYRKSRGGSGTWARVQDSARRMLEAGVSVNALSVVNDYSVRFPEEIYQYHKELGLNYMQFIPIVEKDPDDPNAPAPFTVSAEAFGRFLCKVFDLWLRDFDRGVPTTSIRFFDSVFHIYAGLPPPECTLLENCGVYVVVEHNGDVYACDFFVDPAWRLGNILEDRLVDLLNGEQQQAFGRIKSDLPTPCLQCSWLKYCRGGCPKDRILSGETPALSHLCGAYKAFFDHAHGHLLKLAEEWKAREAAARQREERIREQRPPPGKAPPAKAGRNDPCPCGSGLKHKKCCGRKP